MKPWFVLLVCMVWLGHCDEQTETVTNSDSSTSTEGNTTAENPENENALPSESAEPVVKDNPDQVNDGDPEESTNSNNPGPDADEKSEDTNEVPVAETDEVSVDKATEEHGPSPTENNAEVDSTTARNDESSLDGDNNRPEETSTEKPNPDEPSESDANNSDKREPAEPISEENPDQVNNGNPEESTTHSNNLDPEADEKTENTNEDPVAENDEKSMDPATEEQGPSPPENNAEVDSPTATDDESPLDVDNIQPEKPNPGLVDNVPSESDNKPEGTDHETPVSGDNPETHNPFPPMPGKYKPPKPPARAPPGPWNDGDESETKNDHHIPNPHKQERPKGDDPRNTNSDGNQKGASRRFPPRRNCINTEMTDGHSQTSDMEQADTENGQTETSRNDRKPVRCYPTPPHMEEKHCAILRKIKQLKLDGHAGIKAASWMCFFKYVSNFNTSLTRRSGRGRDYGISQFSNQQHCQDGDLPSRNMCNSDCHKFLDHDLTDDVECLKTIVKNETSLTFWSAWNKHCQGKEHHHYVAGCHP